MKKSEMYKLAQAAVMNCTNIKNCDRLEILRELMQKEDVALFVEEQEKEKANEAI